MKDYNRNNDQTGSILAWILWILAALVIIAGGSLLFLRMGIIKPPEALANQPWMQSFLPAQPQPEPATEQVIISVEDTLRQQVIDFNAKYQAAQAMVEQLKQQLDEKDRTIQVLNDEIARLSDAINLAANRNIGSVALIYEAMDPQEASKILANLGAERAAIILGAMRESKAADVLALMETSLATQITQLMAGFTANPANPQTAPPASPGSGTTPHGSPGNTSPTNPS